MVGIRTTAQRILTKLKNNELSENLDKTYELKMTIAQKNTAKWKTKCLPIIARSFRCHKSRTRIYYAPRMGENVRQGHTIHIDITGKLSGKNDLKEYVIVLIDAFTKFVYFYHTLNIDTESCIKAVKSVVSIFGLPTRIIADQGRCFASSGFREFCSSQKINLHLIATGASRANGQVERVMSTLKNMLTAVETSQRSWQDALADVQLAMNCTANRVTKYSPLELLIGKDVRPFGLLPIIEEDDNDIDRDNLRKQAKRNMEENARYDKYRFDKNKATIIKHNVGDHVLLKNEERHQTKLDPKFKGPFEIIEVLDGDRYTLKSLSSKRTYKYSHEFLRALPNNQMIEELCENKDSTKEDVSNV